MAGAWVSPHLDANAAERAVWAPGDVLEFTHVYEDGSSQGHSLGLVHASRAGCGFDVNLFWLEASDLREWLTSPGGHGNPGGYTPARSTGTDTTKSFGTPPVQPIGVWRRLGRWDQTSFQDVTWIIPRRRGHIDRVFQDAVLAWRRLYPEGGGASDAGARVSHRASSAGSEQVPRSCPASESEGPPTHRRRWRSRSSRRSESTPREPVPKRRRESHVVSSFPPSPPPSSLPVVTRVDRPEVPSLPVPDVMDPGSMAAEIAALRAELKARPVVSVERGSGRPRRVESPEHPSRAPPRGRDARPHQERRGRRDQPRDGDTERARERAASPQHRRHEEERRGQTASPARVRRGTGRRAESRSASRTIPGCRRLPRAASPAQLSPAAATPLLPSHADAERRALKARAAELKAELRDVKRQRQTRAAPREPEREMGASRRTLYGVVFEKDPSPVVKRRTAHHGASRSRSHSSSVFRGTAAQGHDPAVSRLAVWADNHPGVLSARVLQKMSDQLGRDGKKRDWLPEECPPVATAYVHQVLRPQFPSMGARNNRELDTLSEIMDRMAAGEFGRAADLVTQRFKAVEMALHDGDWTRAAHLELLPDSKRLLTSRDEEELIARELREAMRLKKYLDEGRGAPTRVTGDSGKGKGKEKSKEKGSKGHGDSWGDGHSHGKGQGHHGGKQERVQEDRNEPDRKEHDKRKRK